MTRPTAGALQRRAASRLRAAGIDSAELDARVLLAHALGADAGQLLVVSEQPVEVDAERRFDDAVTRRSAREPVAHITGVREFWSRPFFVSRDVLVPRPETETIVEAALRAKPEREAALRILDLGVGSGAILTALLVERPNATGVGVDRSMAALALARSNFDSLGVGARALLVRGDWGRSLDGTFDLVVSNPPYITSREIGNLEPEVRVYEPAAALDGGTDGLDCYRAIFGDLGRLLAPDGAAVLELGEGQEPAVADLARRANILVNGSAVRDLGGLPRALLLGSRGYKKTLGEGREPH